MKTILVMLFSTATLMAAAQDTTVIKMEYFIDQDPGVGKATSINIPAAKNVTFNFTANVASYSLGYHKLFIRTRDDLGRWSLTAIRSIEIIPPDVANNLINGEYFIDTDPGYGQASPIIISPSGNPVLQNFTASTTGLAEGFHKLYGRLRDTHGNWSQTFRRTITIIKSENTKVINGEYFFKTDNGFGDCSPVNFATPAADGTFAFIIPAAQVPSDADTLFVRVRDDIESKWSLTRIAVTNTALPVTLLNFSALKENNTAHLKWQTTNEINTAVFNIQRSSDGIHFSNVGVVNAKNEKGVNDYFYDDNIAGISAAKLYYRLQEVDIDARMTYSDIVTIDPNETTAGYAIYPNPAQDYFNINASKPEDLKGAEISITDLSGHAVLKQTLMPSASQKISIASLSKGMYIIKIVKITGMVVRKLLKE